MKIRDTNKNWKGKAVLVQTFFIKKAKIKPNWISGKDKK